MTLIIGVAVGLLGGALLCDHDDPLYWAQHVVATWWGASLAATAIAVAFGMGVLTASI